MKRWLGNMLLSMAAVAVCASASPAQTGAVITGTVSSDEGQPVQLATVSIASLGLGANTNESGRYTIVVPASRLPRDSAVLSVTARRVGFSLKTVSVVVRPNGTVTQNFTLVTLAANISGVVVTALGTEREKSTLGTAQQQLSSAELTKTHDPSVLKLLEGKVSGVQITGSGTTGGTSTIRIRGNNSLSGNNEPLWVIDGVPLLTSGTNASGGSGATATGGGSAGRDLGNSVSDINPEDIATISILKGPNAAALYGSRAANGVIVITTKKGASTGENILTNLTVSGSQETPSKLPDFQNLYGQGTGGQFRFVDGKGNGLGDGLDQSFGPRLDGRLIDQFNGKQLPWIARPDNVSSFFVTGHTVNSSLSFAGGTERANARTSFSMENVDGYVPNLSTRKLSGSLNGSFKVNDRLSTSVSIQDVQSKGKNRGAVGYSNGIMEQFFFFGRQVDVKYLKDHVYDEFGNPVSWNYNFHNNPYFIQYANSVNDQRDNLIGSASATYILAPWLNVTARLAQNQQVTKNNFYYAKGNILTSFRTDPNFAGGFDMQRSSDTESNTEILFTATKQFGTHLGFNGLAGANKRLTSNSSNRIQTTGILVPNVYNVSNAAIVPTLTNNEQRRQINSGYGSASFTWNNWWTVEGTARQDYSSTLPKGNNAYSYPSINTSMVLTEALPRLRSSVLSYLKVRAASAKVGADANPYQLAAVYNGNSAKFNNLPQYTIGGTLPPLDLKPEITKSNEVGVEASFLDGRVTLDASYYSKKTTNQILAVTVSGTSGFGAQSLNAGAVANRGTEALLTANVLSARGFDWKTTFNFTANRSSVLALYPGLDNYVIGTFDYSIEARVGKPYGVMVGRKAARDANGQLLLTQGLPTRETDSHVYGNINPRWIGGWNNEFTFKRFSLSLLIDTHQGGNIYSRSNRYGEGYGILSSSIPGREVDWNNPGIVAKGIDVKTGQPNQVRVTAESYYIQLSTVASGEYLYDATYTRLREMRLSWDVPPAWTRRVNAASISLALVGRNLLLWDRFPNMDPEFSYSSGNLQGTEFANTPNPRSFGFNVRVTP